MDKLDKDIVRLMSKRVFDVAGCNPTLEVYLNETRLKANSFADYCSKFLKIDSLVRFFVNSIHLSINSKTFLGRGTAVAFHFRQKRHKEVRGRPYLP